MAGEFAAIPPVLARVSGFVGDVGSRESGVAAQMDDVRAGDCAMDPGDMASFWEQWHWVQGALQAQADWLDSHADKLGKAANTIQASDSAGVFSPMAANGAGSPTNGSGSPVGGSGSVPGTLGGGVPTTGAANGVGSPANVAASPSAAPPSAATGSGGAAGGRGGGTGSGGYGPESPSSPGRAAGGTPSQGDGGGKDPGATSAGPVGGGSPGDGGIVGAGAEDETAMRLGASSPEGMLEPSTSPAGGPSTDGAGPTPPNLPPLPALPNPPAPPNQRRRGAKDQPGSPSSTEDERSGRLSSVTGRVVGEGVAGVRRGMPDSSRRSGIARDPLVADTIGLVAGHRGGGGDDTGGSHPGDQRGLGEDWPSGSHADDDDVRGPAR